MNDWFPTQRLRRHAVRRSFDALARTDVLAVREWARREGLVDDLKGLLLGERSAFFAAALGHPLDADALLGSWWAALAEQAAGSRAPDDVQAWVLDRPRVWIEGEVRRRFGRSITAALAAGFRSHGLPSPDRLFIDAALCATVFAAVDAAEGYDPERPLEPWLVGVARNTARDLCRVEEARALRLPRAEVDPADVAARRPSELARIDDLEERAWLEGRALVGATLPGESVIVASILDGNRSAASVGEELSLSAKRVYKRTAAARGRLRAAALRLRRP